MSEENTDTLTSDTQTNPPAPAPAAPSEPPAPQPAAGGRENTTQPPADPPAPTGKDSTGTATDTKDGSDVPPQDVEYAFEYPEGFQDYPDPVADDMLKAYAKEKGYGQEDAAALSELRFDMIRHLHATLGQKQEQQKQLWEQEVRADPDLGGANYERTREDCNKGLLHFAPELVDKLAAWNLENEPNMMRVFARLGKSLRENTSPRGDNPSDYRKRTLLDDKEAMLAEEERKRSGK